MFFVFVKFFHSNFVIRVSDVLHVFLTSFFLQIYDMCIFNVFFYQFTSFFLSNFCDMFCRSQMCHHWNGNKTGISWHVYSKQQLNSKLIDLLKCCHSLPNTSLCKSHVFFFHSWKIDNSIVVRIICKQNMNRPTMPREIHECEINEDKNY
jgi:hypothetical protein